jgi:hypothetical protein
MLDQTLTDSGILSLYNSNYFFDGLPLSSNYAAVRSTLIHTNGFVDKWDTAGQRISRALNAKLEPDRQHVLVGDTSELTDDHFRDCIFEKNLDKPIDLSIGFADAGAVPDEALASRVIGLDVVSAADEGRIASSLKESFFNAADGTGWIRREWRKSTVSGQIVSFDSWWLPASLEQVGVFSQSQQNAIQSRERFGGWSSKSIEKASRPIRHRLFELITGRPYDHWKYGARLSRR